MKKEYLVFATRTYQYLAEEFIDQNTFCSGEVLFQDFEDGERQIRILSELHNRHVIVIGGTSSDIACLELYDLCSGLVQHGAHQLHVIIPYFGYGTQERVVNVGDVVIAKNRANLLTSIPVANQNTSFTLFDLHSPGIAYYFDASCQCKELSAKSIFIDVIEEVKTTSNEVVVASADAGRAKVVESFANAAGLAAAFVYKRRTKDNNKLVTGINADVKNKTVVLYDDIIRSGGSLVNAAKTYMDQGAQRVIACASHGVFHADTLNRIKSSGAVESVHITNSHPSFQMLDADPYLHVHKIGSILQNGFS